MAARGVWSSVAWGEERSVLSNNGHKLPDGDRKNPFMRQAYIPSVCATCGAILAFLAIALGAFGAHALRSLSAPGQWESGAASLWETAVLYQMFHALALLVLGGFPVELLSNRMRAWVGGSFVLGTMLFCGSLYLLAVIRVPPLGMLTPVGGLLLLAGWGVLGVVFWRTSRERH